MIGVELVCAARAYLDLTFTGLRELPQTGHEAFSEGLFTSPGGGALNAIGAARLGLITAGAFALGDDQAGSFLWRELTAEGIWLLGEQRGRTPVTVVMPHDGDRAFVTYDPETLIDLSPLEALGAERFIYTLDQVGAFDSTARSFVTVGDREAIRYAGRPLPVLPPGATVFVNAGEAAQLTGYTDTRDATRALAEWAEVAVVTRGRNGALACTGNALFSAPGIDVDPVDTTGAGDLFAAAWIWGDARRIDPEARLHWAVLYSAMSVTVPTAAAGAAGLDALLAEGATRGFSLPSNLGAAGLQL